MVRQHVFHTHGYGRYVRQRKEDADTGGRRSRNGWKTDQTKVDIRNARRRYDQFQSVHGRHKGTNVHYRLQAKEVMSSGKPLSRLIGGAASTMRLVVNSK